MGLVAFPGMAGVGWSDPPLCVSWVSRNVDVISDQAVLSYIDVYNINTVVLGCRKILECFVNQNIQLRDTRIILHFPPTTINSFNYPKHPLAVSSNYSPCFSLALYPVRNDRTEFGLTL